MGPTLQGLPPPSMQHTQPAGSPSERAFSYPLGQPAAHIPHDRRGLDHAPAIEHDPGDEVRGFDADEHHQRGVPRRMPNMPPARGSSCLAGRPLGSFGCAGNPVELTRRGWCCVDGGNVAGLGRWDIITPRNTCLIFGAMTIPQPLRVVLSLSSILLSAVALGAIAAISAILSVAGIRVRH